MKFNINRKLDLKSLIINNLKVLGYICLVAGVFYAVSFLISVLMQLVLTKVPLSMNRVLLTVLISTVVYLLTILIVFLITTRALKVKLTKANLGVQQRLPRWRDLGLGIAALIISLIVAQFVIEILKIIFPDLDIKARQNLPFQPGQIKMNYEMFLVFLTLVVIAPVCEEMLFRGYLQSRIRAIFNKYYTVIVSGMAFGAMHLFGGIGMPLQWNAMISISVLGFFLGALREYTDSLWAPLVLHMGKNLIAFFAIFVLVGLLNL